MLKSLVPTFPLTFVSRSNKALCTAGNELLVSICFQLAKRSYTSSSSVLFVADTLKTALPHINCKCKPAHGYSGTPNVGYPDFRIPCVIRTPGHPDFRTPCVIRAL